MGTQQGLVSLPQALEHQEVPCLERWNLDWTSHVNGAQVGKWRPEETCRQGSGRRTGGSLPTSQTQPSVSLGIKWRKHFLLHQMLWRLSQIKRRECRAQYLTFVCVQELLVSVTIVTSRSYNPLISTIYYTHLKRWGFSSEQRKPYFQGLTRSLVLQEFLLLSMEQNRTLCQGTLAWKVLN